ncbi:MAG TPA: response regulator, partial [Bacilli bacterium]|nr:response regulator [Bacilli bacterium]
MIKIIIVEDEKRTQEQIKKIVIETLFSTNLEFEIKIFNKYNENLQQLISDESLQKIFLLDIELNSNISGINIADMIRKNDWESEIIFLTNHDKMFEPVYRNIYKVFDFIEKYHNLNERLKKDLKKIVAQNYD